MLPPRFFSKNITGIFGGKKIRRRRFILAGLVFAFWATCLLHPKIVLGEYSAENPPVLHVGDLTLRTHADKRTTPSLHIKPPGNQVFYIDLAEDNGYSHGLRIAYGGEVYSAGRYELFYEATSVNQCETVLLTPGGIVLIYAVVVAAVVVALRYDTHLLWILLVEMVVLVLREQVQQVM